MVMPNINWIPFSSESTCQVPGTSATCKTSVQLQEVCQMMLYAFYINQKAPVYPSNVSSIHKYKNETTKRKVNILKVHFIQSKRGAKDIFINQE